MPAMLGLWRQMMDFHAKADSRFRPKESPLGEEAWEKFISEHAWTDDAWCVLVGVDDGRVVGHCLGVLRESYPVYVPSRHGVVLDIVVDAAARRGGVGSALFAEMKAWFRQNGADHVELSVAHHNAVSQAFWRAMGCTDYMDTMWFALNSDERA
jgi:ribosomal protein S18 acetylase RimI-like enzyme